MKIGILKIKLENWSFDNYLRIGVSKIILKLEFRKLFENWSFENYFKIEVLRIKFKDWSFESGVLKD